MRIVKRVALCGIAALVLCVMSLFSAAIFQMLDEDPLTLLVRINSQPIVAPVAKKILIHKSLSPETVSDLNRQAGAYFPVEVLDDGKEAEELLLAFIEHGVDINAGNQTLKNLTALHSIAMQGDVKRAQLLVKHGARIDVKDALGRTPLDYVKSAQPRYREALTPMIDFLEVQSQLIKSL